MAPQRQRRGKLNRLGVIVGLVLALTACRDTPAEAGSDQGQVTLAAVPRIPMPTSGADLGRFYRDLARLDAGQIDQVHILQLGDSHTAADFFSGRLRTLLQQRFGDAGRGIMPPGLAFDGMSQRVVSVTQSGGWAIENSLFHPELGPYGVTGFVARSTHPGSRMAVSPKNDAGFDVAIVDYLRSAGGGSFDVYLDDKLAATVSTAGSPEQPGHLVLKAPSSAHQLAIATRSAGIGITAWSVERRSHGVLLESQGVVSARVDLFDHWDPTIVQHNIEDLKPSLIILAYGTNEGFDSGFDATNYEQHFDSVVARLKRFAPQASILVVGPPDGQRVDSSCAARRTAPERCHWATPAALPAVRAIQRETAMRDGVAFWDWASVMPEGMGSWVSRDLGRPDHVHFTVQGYETAADQLFDHLMQGYQAYQATLPGSVKHH